MKDKQNAARFEKLAVENALRFAFNVLFVFAFQILFGAENILPAVAVCVGLTILPYMDLGIRPLPMAGMILFFYMGAGFAAQFALASPWLALPVNFIFVLLLLLLCSEPFEKRGFISFLLCFVFCQANPVAPAVLPEYQSTISENLPLRIMRVQYVKSGIYIFSIINSLHFHSSPKTQYFSAVSRTTSLKPTAL